MLILTRTIGQQVEILFPGQPPVLITVNEIRGRRVVLGFVAAEEVRIRRPEAKTIPMPKAS